MPCGLVAFGGVGDDPLRVGADAQQAGADARCGFSLIPLCWVVSRAGLRLIRRNSRGVGREVRQGG
eukprot:359604-Chlamydomonas_euryale.AAC.4